MGEKSAVSERMLLALAILKRLPVHGYKTVKEIHQELENEGRKNSYRSIQRLLLDLETSSIIQCNDSSKPHRFKLLPNTRVFSLSKLSNHESLLLRLAEEYLKDLLPPKLSKSMKSLFDNSRTRLDDRTEDSIKLDKQWLNKVMMLNEGPSLMPLNIDLEIFEKVADALYQNSELKVFYETRNGKQSEKVIRPLGMVQQGLRLYIAVNQKDRTGYYPMAIHRIKTATISTIKFDVPSDFDLKNFIQQEKFNFGDGSKVEVEFVLRDDEAAIHLRETPLSTDQTIKNLDDGSLQFKANVVDSRLIDKYIFGFGTKLCSYKKTKSDGSSETWLGPTRSDQ
jgi:predicted DNA-binding transcriptional regulator YafY